MMYNHNYGYRVPLSERIFWEIQRLFLVLIGVVLLLVAPVIQNYLLQEDFNQLENSLKVFCTKQDLWQAPELPGEAENIEIEAFKRTFIQVYEVKVSSDYHVYEGEISFGKLKSTIKDTNNGVLLDAPKVLTYVAYACIVLNLIWYPIGKVLRCTFVSCVEELLYKLREHINY